MNIPRVLTSRLYLKIGLLFLAFVITAWVPLFLQGLVPVNGEVVRFTYPTWCFSHRSLNSFHLPFWNPYRSMGEPFLADPRSMVLYPPYLLLSVISSFHIFLQAWVLFHTFLASFFAFLWARQRFDDLPAALTAAVVAGFNGFFLAHAPYINQYAAAAFLPAIFYFYDRRSARGLGLAWALQWLAGYPPFVIISLIAVLGMSVVNPKPEKRFLLHSGLWALGLAAVQWIPFVELLSQTTRAVFLDPQTATQFSIPLPQLLKELFVPCWIGWKPEVVGDPIMVTFYTGVVALGLAGWGIYRGHWRERVLGALAALGLILSLGGFLPGYNQMTILHVFRFPASWLLLPTLAITLLSGSGVARLATKYWKWTAFILVALDVLVFAQVPSIAWFKRDWLSAPPPLVQEIHDAGNAVRLYHPPFFKQTWLAMPPLSNLADYDLMKYTLTPSYGMAWNISDVNSYQIWRLRSTQDYLDRLEKEGPGSRLTQHAGIGYVVTLTQGAQQITSDAIRIMKLPGNTSTLFFKDKGVSPKNILAVIRRVPEQIKIQLHSSTLDTLIFAEVYYPGWHARVDGLPVTLERFDNTFMAVPVPAGEHEVELYYTPMTFYIGLIITGIVLMLGLRAYLYPFIGKRLSTSTGAHVVS